MSETKKTLTKNLSSAQREFVIILIQSIWPVGCVSHWRPNHRLISADSVPPHSTLCAFGCWRRGSTGKCGSHVQLYSAPVAVAAAAAAAGKMWGRQFLAFGRQGFIRRENWLFHINPLMIINSGCHVFSSSNLLQKAERERTGCIFGDGGWWIQFRQNWKLELIVAITSLVTLRIQIHIAEETEGNAKDLSQPGF